MALSRETETDDPELSAVSRTDDTCLINRFARGSADHITGYHVEVLIDSTVKPVPVHPQATGYIKSNDD
jgi:hypothetical protein